MGLSTKYLNIHLVVGYHQSIGLWYQSWELQYLSIWAQLATKNYNICIHIGFIFVFIVVFVFVPKIIIFVFILVSYLYLHLYLYFFLSLTKQLSSPFNLNLETGKIFQFQSNWFETTSSSPNRPKLQNKFKSSLD